MILSRGSSAEQPQGFFRISPPPQFLFYSLSRAWGYGMWGTLSENNEKVWYTIVCQERTILQKSLVILSFHFVGELRRGPRMLLCTLIFKFKSRDGARVPSKGAADNIFKYIIISYRQCKLSSLLHMNIRILHTHSIHPFVNQFIHTYNIEVKQ